MNEPTSQRKPSESLERQISRIILQTMIAGTRLPQQMEGLNLHSATLDPDVPGRIRVSYRAPDYEEAQEAA